VLGSVNVPDQGGGVVLPSAGSNGGGAANGTPWLAAFGLIVAGLSLVAMTLTWRERR
jgi:hypothetical protein